MIIMCKKGYNPNNPVQGKHLEAGQQVNRIGKYLYKHLDSSYDIKFTPNTCDVWFTLYYQIPYLQRRPGMGEYNTVSEMNINLSITTYQNKVRVNTIEVTPEEKTLGFDLFKPEVLENLVQSQELIMNKVRKRVETAYKDYDFVY